MNLWLLAVLVFGIGASVTRLITRDSALERFRDRWGNHFAAKQDVILHRLASQLPAKRSYSAPTLTWPEQRVGLLREVGERSEQEQAIGFWVHGKKRVERQPWTTESYRLIWWRTMIEFIGCPWCVSFWVYLVTWIVGWGVGLHFAYDIAGAPFWFVLPGLVLSYRWLYALLATRLDND